MSNPRLLVIDDHWDTLCLLETFLSLCGFDVVTATNGAEGLALAANDIDAVATDLAMPEMDGFEFVRRLRAVRTKAPVPIVAVTGQSFDAANALAWTVGCCRVVQKPCDLVALADTLHALVGTCIHQCERCPVRQVAAGQAESAKPG